MIEGDARILWSWAVHHCSPWLGSCLDRSVVRAELNRFNQVSTVGYVFDIQKGKVKLLPKPSNIEHIERNVHGELRSEFYRKFLQDVVDVWLPRIDTTICISMCDGAAHHPYLPTFCFQKVGDMAQILLPDIDFLNAEFYEEDEFVDLKVYEDKLDAAIFIGSTTGVINTHEVAQALSSPRLDAARFFLHDQDVRFELPAVVQCESDSVRDFISSFPFCGGGRVPWSDQLKYRYLISMDGNGATCSRVVLSLKSNSVLLKYNSPCKLYYFDFLKPNMHYIDIRQHQDVLDVLKVARRWPGIFASIADAGREFAECFLGRAGVQFYMAALLAIYDNSILEPKKSAAPTLDMIFSDLMKAPLRKLEFNFRP